jgi:putative ABC transport system permease protein
MRRWARRLATLLGGGRAEAEVREEIQLHIDLEAAELERRGMTREQARREALRRFGGVDRHREAVRHARGVGAAQDLLQDVRYAFRGLARSPGFAAVALLTLALGIGASTAIFTVVDAVLLRPLPYPDPDELVRVRPSWEGTPVARLSPAEYLDLRELEVFAGVGVYAFGTANLTGEGEPERLQAAFASWGVLPALGLSPARGRAFGPEEDETGARVALLSHGLWTRRFAADPDVVGDRILLNGNAWEVVGILPEAFLLPEDLASSGPAEILLPLGIDPAATSARGSHYLFGVARLAPGVSREAALGAVAAAGEAMVAAWPDDYPRDMGFRLEAPSLADEVLGGARPALRVLVGAVAFLLLIACANVANLLLARAEARERELTLRRALGAGRRRIFRQLMVESVVLALLGSVLGAGVAWLASAGLLALQPPDLPRIRDVGVNGSALVFGTLLASLTGVLFGLFPALRVSREDPARSLAGGRGGAGRRRGGRLRQALVAAQVSAALVLLTGAGLFVRTLVGLLSTDPGYRTEGVLTAEVALPSARYAEQVEVSLFFDRLLARLGSTPGVTGVGAVSNLPLAAPLGDLNFRIEGRPVAEGDVSPRADWQVVTPGYLEAMGVPLLQGRLITAADHGDAPGVVVLGRTAAARYWPEGGALGARFVLGGGAAPGEVTVVGIVEDVAHAELGAGPTAQMYLPHAQFRFWNGGGPVRSLDLVLVSAGDPGQAAATLRDAVRALDPELPVASVRTMEEVVAVSLARSRLLAWLVGAFAALALALASVGIYGVTAYAVGRRTRELGIRMALGAGAPRVLAMVMGEGVRTLLAGLLVGALGALLLTRALTRGLGELLYGVVPWDPVTLAGAAALLAAVGGAAFLFPAWRATRVDPATPLRAD